MNMQVNLKVVPPVHVLYRRDRLTLQGVSEHAGPAIDSLFTVLNRAGVAQAGPLIFVYYGIETDPTQEFDLDICVPVPADAVIPTTAPMGCKMLPTFECLSADYVGSMHQISAAWRFVADAWRASGRKGSGESREVYKVWVNFDSPDDVTELQKGIVTPNPSV